jgi:hypothetical protein
VARLCVDVTMMVPGTLRRAVLFQNPWIVKGLLGCSRVILRVFEIENGTGTTFAQSLAYVLTRTFRRLLHWEPTPPFVCAARLL